MASDQRLVLHMFQLVQAYVSKVHRQTTLTKLDYQCCVLRDLHLKQTAWTYLVSKIHAQPTVIDYPKDHITNA